VLVYKNQSKPRVARELLKFFDWAYHDGANLAEGLDYVPMPQPVVQLVEAAWTAIKDPDGGPAWKGVTLPQH
jgi:phosphate transport system substrate-binding protein